MTKRDGAIISAYTGYLIGDFIDMLDYASEKLERTLFDSELGNAIVRDELKEKTKEDFINLCKNLK